MRTAFREGQYCNKFAHSSKSVKLGTHLHCTLLFDKINVKFWEINASTNLGEIQYGRNWKAVGLWSCIRNVLADFHYSSVHTKVLESSSSIVEIFWEHVNCANQFIRYKAFKLQRRKHIFPRVFLSNNKYQITCVPSFTILSECAHLFPI